MKLKQHRKHRKFVSSAVSLLLIFTMILSFSVYVFAETPDFTGTIPTEAEKNSLQENREYIPSEKEEMTLSEKGLPIIFETVIPVVVRNGLFDCLLVRIII